MTERVLSLQQLELFRENLIREEKSPATIEKYMRDARAFAGYSKGICISKEQVLEYKKALMEKGYAIRSINSMLASVNSLLAFLGWSDCKVNGMYSRAAAVGQYTYLRLPEKRTFQSRKHVH